MSSRNVLALPIPSSPNLSSHYTACLRQAIVSHSGESHHPDAFASDISSLVDLRARVGAMEAHAASLDLAYRYYAQLVFATTKLPTTVSMSFPWAQPLVPVSFLGGLASGGTGGSHVDSSSGSTAELAAIWKKTDEFAVTYDGVVFVGHPLIAWERANVLYSIATLASTLGAQESRNDGASIKRAVAYFQTSSAILSHLETQVMPSLMPQLSPTAPSHGLTPVALQPLATLSLAQAQECFWQKAVSDGMKSGTVAKLAAAVEELYEQAIEQAKRAEIEHGIEAIPRTWVNHITVKRHHFGAAAQYRKSQDDLASSRYGDEIARLQLAEGYVKSALAAFKKGLPGSTSSEAVGSDLKGLQGVIESNLKRAKKDNDLIYLEPVTPAGSLAPVSPARMVTAKLPVEVAKPIECLRAPGSAVGSSDAALPALGKPLFAALVPYGAHLAISVYEDRKDSWWRDTVEGKRQELEALVRSTLESLSLPAALDALDRNGASGHERDLPRALIQQMQKFRSLGGLTALYRLKGDVDKMSQVNGSTLIQAQSALEAESKEDASVRETFNGSQHWGRQESKIAGQAYWRRLEELKGTLKMARESDAVVQTKMTKWSQGWQILEAGDEAIKAQLPSEAGGSSNSSSSMISSSSSIVRELRSTLERIDDVLAEFASLATETRSLVRSDDIREKVMREVVRLSSNATGDQGLGGQGGYAGEIDLSAEMFEGLFDAEFRKYKSVETQLDGFEKNVAGLLERATTQNEEFAAQLKANSATLSKRNSILSNLSLSSSKFFEVHSNLSEGLKFYNSLAPMITQFKQEVDQWRRAREIDVQQLVARFGGTSLEDRRRPWEGGGGGEGAQASLPSPSAISGNSPRSTAAGSRKSHSSTPSRRTTRSQATQARKSISSPLASSSTDAQSVDQDENDEEEVVSSLGDDGNKTPTNSRPSSPSAPGQPPLQQPAWGQWSGGSIRFAD